MGIVGWIGSPHDIQAPVNDMSKRCEENVKTDRGRPIEVDAKVAPAGRIVGERDRPALLCAYPRDQRQPDAVAARRIASREGFEEPVALDGRNAGAGIDDAETVLAQGHGDSAALGVVQGIANQVRQHRCQ